MEQIFYNNITIQDYTIYKNIIYVSPDTYTIQEAINGCNEGDTVLVDVGIYVENINFEGKGITVCSKYATTSDTSFITQTKIDGNEAGHVVTFDSDEDTTSVLCGISIINGKPNFVSYPQNCGGGIFCHGASPLIQNLIIKDNSSNIFGGGIFCSYSSSPSIYNSKIYNNIAGSGGGIYIDDFSNPIILNSAIYNNEANLYGGGILCGNDCYPILKNLTIKENEAINGGGIAVISTTVASIPNIKNNTIILNISTEGSGIYCENSTPQIENCIISTNYNSYGIYSENANPSITYSDLYDNDVGNFYGCGQWYGVNVTTNANGDSCDTYFNIQMDPLFVDQNNDDFHLTPNSPCIDAGDPSSPYDPDGTIADMGAYYLNQSTTVPGIPTEPIPEDSSENVSISTNLHWINGNFTSTIDLYFDTNNPPLNKILDNISQIETYTPGVLIYNKDYYWKVVCRNNNGETIGDVWSFTTEIYEGPVWYVSTTGSDSTGDGSVQNPFRTIQQGINISTIGDTVIVEPGTYIENIDYDGKSIVLCSRYMTSRDSSYISQTIIDGNNEGSVVNFSNGEDWNSRLFGFTLINGLGSYVHPLYFGGGINCYQSSPHLSYLIIRENNADYGGGCLIQYGSPIINHVIIHDNFAYDGGGILCHSSSPEITNVTITDNNVDYWGSGIFCGEFSSPIINNCIVSNNQEDFGIYNSTTNPGSPVITYSNFYNNEDGNYYGVNDSIGVNATTNANGDSCDVFFNIQQDPLYIDPLNDDYHLSWINFPIPDETKSPCIDAGDPASPLDPDGTIADLGAYYFNQNVTSIEDPNTENKHVLKNYPSPIGSALNSVNISFMIEKSGNVTLHLFNIKGQLISNLIDEEKTAGEYSLSYGVQELKSGLYFLRLSLNGTEKEIRKILVIK